MRLKNVLIAVKDIERSRKFYHDLFGLVPVLESDGNMILTEGLVLQEKEIWKAALGKEIIPRSNSCELYFEERDLDGFVKKLEEQYPDVELPEETPEEQQASWERLCARIREEFGEDAI